MARAQIVNQPVLMIAGCLAVLGLIIWSAAPPQHSKPMLAPKALALAVAPHPAPVPAEPAKPPSFIQADFLYQSAPTVVTTLESPEPPVSPPPLPPVFYRIPTSEPVVFLTIDDGWIKDPDTQDWLIEHQLPFTLFLTNDGVKDNYGYFVQLQQAGMTIQDHTLTHPHLTKLTPDEQRAEICGTADTYAQVFGSRPTLFRPPYGEFDEATRQVAAACGMKAIVLWHASVNGGSMNFQDEDVRLHPGDIVLMHFRHEFVQDVEAFMNQVQKDNLKIGRLEDWLQ